MIQRRKPRVGIGLVLVIFGLIDIITSRNANLANRAESTGYFLFAAVMIAFGLWFILRGRSAPTPDK
jgi:hypothetical protein